MPVFKSVKQALALYNQSLKDPEKRALFMDMLQNTLEEKAKLPNKKTTKKRR